MKTVYSLELINITKKFDNQNVVENLNLSILPGKVTCLLGPSGCGKSTTLRIAAGLETQDSGIIKINGNLISEPNVSHLPPEKRNIGFMFQDFALFPHLTVKKNIEFLSITHKYQENLSYGEKKVERIFARFAPVVVALVASVGAAAGFVG